MSWLFSQALVEEYLGDTCLDGEQFALLSGNPTQQAYCAPDKMTVFSRLSRFGMTYKPLTESRGEELLTLFREDFLVPTFQPQEKAQELMEKPQECGEKWRASFTKYDPDTSLWKTHQCSLLGDLDEFLETWPQWGLMRCGECWEQRTLEQTIRGTGYGLSPNGVDSFHTPNTIGLDGGSNSRKALRKRTEMWPTPVSHDAKDPIGAPAEGKRKTPNLAWRVNNWPSPKARDWKDGTTEGTSNRMSPDLGKLVGQSKETGSLNPTWVEWLMGWPLGWTELKPLETDKSHFVQQPLGES
jgi:hypothetical protein